MQDLTGKTPQDLIDMLDPKTNDPAHDPGRIMPRDPTTETEPTHLNRLIPFPSPTKGGPCSR